MCQSKVPSIFNDRKINKALKSVNDMCKNRLAFKCDITTFFSDRIHLVFYGSALDESNDLNGSVMRVLSHFDVNQRLM